MVILVSKTPIGQRLAILPVSKARTNKFYTYRQCTYIVYIYIYTCITQHNTINGKDCITIDIYIRHVIQLM